MKTTPRGQVDQPTQIQDEGSGYFSMIPNIVFVLGLSPTAGWVYAKLKCKAGANLDSLPAEERRISKLIGVSRGVWNRESKELRHFGLIRIENKTVILTDVFQVNWKYFKGKISITAARLAIQALGEKGAKDILFGPCLRNLGPERGRNLGPERGQKSGPERGHMINNMKNKNMGPSHRRSKVPTEIEKPRRSDDEIKHISTVQGLFEKLSNGGTWKDSRDLSEYEKVKHCSVAVIACGLCYSVTKSPEHRLSSFGYAVNSILDHQRDIGEYAFLIQDSRAAEMETVVALSIRTGKWTADAMTPAEWDEYKQARKEARRKAG